MSNAKPVSTPFDPFDPMPGSILWYQNGCMAIDPSRIIAVHVEGTMEKSGLEPGEAIVTCFVTWRWYDVYWLRKRLNARVWNWIDRNRLVVNSIELRFVENYPE